MRKLTFPAMQLLARIHDDNPIYNSVWEHLYWSRIIDLSPAEDCSCAWALPCYCEAHWRSATLGERGPNGEVHHASVTA